jgi:hypothetical protein
LTFVESFFPVTTKTNKTLKVVTDFKVALRHAQHAAIFECFRAFNRKGGAIVPLQSGGEVYFARACILAIYADQPAARKCTLTGSACPVCYTPEKHMALAEQQPRHAVLRTEENMKRRKRIFKLMSQSAKPAANEKAIKRAKQVGVNLDLDNAWFDGDAPQEEMVLGTCPKRDNVFQIMPQPNLHGMDEGLTKKTNHGCLEFAMAEAKELHNIDPTKVRSPMTTNFHHDVHYNVHCAVHSDVRYSVHYNVQK